MHKITEGFCRGLAKRARPAPAVKLALTITAALVIIGCIQSIPILPPINTSIPLGINGFYHGESYSQVDLNRIKSWKSPSVRAAISDESELDYIFQQSSGIHITLLVEVIDDYLISVLANRNETFDLELVNEPDLNNSVTEADWCAFLNRSSNQLNNFKGKLISGGLSNVQRKTLNWIDCIPPGFVIGLHIYHDINNPNGPSKGYNTRYDENNYIKYKLNDRPARITEFGYFCLNGCDQNKILSATGIDLSYFSDLLVDEADWYQFRNGLINTNINRYALLPLIENMFWR